MFPSQIARVVHEANRALQIEQADPTIPVSRPWDEQRDRGRRRRGQRKHPGASHQGWCEFKVKHGWRHGPVKDEAKKEHPLLVPYDQLPEAQKVKDSLFCAIVNTLKHA